MDNVFAGLEAGNGDALAEYLEDRIRSTYILHGARGLSNWMECAPHAIIVEMLHHLCPPDWSYDVEAPGSHNCQFADIVVDTPTKRIVVEVKFVPYNQLVDVVIGSQNYQKDYEDAYKLVEEAENPFKLMCRKNTNKKCEQWVRSRYIKDEEFKMHTTERHLEADCTIIIIVIGHRVFARPLVECS